MKRKKGYIKNLDYNLYSNFGKKYLSVSYDRDGEFNNYVLSHVPEWVKNEKTVRKYINM